MSATAHPECPVRTDLIPYEDLFVEPFYQLLRLHLLALEMERACELGAQTVRVVYAVPALNGELRGSLNRESHRDLGDNLFDVWRALLRKPDRFAVLDTAELVAPGARTSAEFKERYSHLTHREDGEARNQHQDSTQDCVDRLRSAVWVGRTVLMRVGCDGGILDQVGRAPDDVLRDIPLPELVELAVRLEEATEAVRRVRAEPGSAVWDRVNWDSVPDVRDDGAASL